MPWAPLLQAPPLLQRDLGRGQACLSLSEVSVHVAKLVIRLAGFTLIFPKGVRLPTFEILGSVTLPQHLESPLLTNFLTPDCCNCLAHTPATSCKFLKQPPAVHSLHAAHRGVSPACDIAGHLVNTLPCYLAVGRISAVLGTFLKPVPPSCHCPRDTQESFFLVLPLGYLTEHTTSSPSSRHVSTLPQSRRKCTPALAACVLRLSSPFSYSLGPPA